MPVLSKQTVFILPPTTTLGGDMQNILLSSNLFNAKLIPTVNAAVNYGGIEIVIKSRNFKTILRGSMRILNLGYKIQNPTIVKITNTTINYILYLKNLNLFGYGYKIFLINYPLTVWKEVLMTKAIAKFYFYSIYY